MGYGSYTALDWSKLKTERSLSKASSIERVFKNTRASDTYKSNLVKMRESCDSVDSPNSTPIIIGFDVTSSMGFLAKELAVDSLNKTIVALYEKQPIKDPHVLCSAVGDCKSDDTPLQVTQFEADIRIIKQLTDLCIEGGGGGNGGESYNLLWYFAAKRTKIDSFIKRKKKGFLFTIGDDYCHPELLVAEIKRVFGDTVNYNLSNMELIEEVSKMYNVFHIHLETSMSQDKNIFSAWQQLLPNRSTVIHANDVHLISDLIVSIISIASGESANFVLKKLDQTNAEKLSRSIAHINFSEDNNTILF